MMDILLHDLRYTARNLQRNAFFTGVTALTLGLGVGVLTALFSVINAVLLHPIAAEQDRIVRIWKQDIEGGLDRGPLSYPEYRQWREQTRSFDALVAVNYADAFSAAIIVEGQSAPVRVTPVSADFFAVLHDGKPLYGRWFQPADEQAGTELVGVVSGRFWRRVAAGDSASVGRRLTWAGGDRTLLVIGVAPAEFDYPLGTDIWVPIARFFDATTGPTHMRVFDVDSRRFAQFELIGRLGRGVSLDQLRAELAVLEARWHAQFPNDHRLERVVVTPLLDTVVGNGRQVLLFLFGAAGLVFVIAGVNVAALLLMRASERRRELAIRVALGASHTRLVRQTVTEGLLLGALGALCGLLFAQVFLGILRWLEPTGVPRIEHAAIDVGALAVCVAAALLWALAVGTVPAWGYRSLEAVLRTSPGELCFRGAHGTNGLRMFTIAQIAGAIVVAIGAGLLVRSFMHLQRIERGFASSNLAVIPLLLPESRYPDARARLAFYDQLLPHVDAIPGVIAASPLHVGPGTGTAGLSARMMFEGQTPDEADRNPWASWEPVTPSYFRTLGIPIVRGRGFTDADSLHGAPVAIVSEAVARRYWPGQDPLGRRLQVTRELPWVTVVGVAADLRYRELTRTWLTVYFPAAQFFFFSPNSLVVRTASAPELLSPVIRLTIRAQEPHAAVESITTMDALLARELSRPRTALTVAAVFAMMAIVLAAVGVYGVLSYEVRQRWRELAVRSVLGASPAAIFRAVLLRSLILGGIGVAVGLAASSMFTRSLRSLLFEIGPTDPGMFLATAGTLLTIVLLASYLPARRAAGADPAAVLRSE